MNDIKESHPHLGRTCLRSENLSSLPSTVPKDQNLCRRSQSKPHFSGTKYPAYARLFSSTSSGQWASLINFGRRWKNRWGVGELD